MEKPETPSHASISAESVSTTLLNRVKTGETDAWRQLVELFGPVVYGWARRRGLQASDAADVVQDVFRKLFDCVNEFRRDDPRDSFRGWLWTIARNTIRDRFRRPSRAVGVGGTEALQRMANVPQPAEESEEEREDACSEVAHRALEFIAAEFEPRTLQAFWQVAVERRPAAAVAEDLGMSLRAVYQAKYRVLHRLRQELDSP